MRYLFVFITSLFHFINLSAYGREFSVNQIYASLDTIDYFIKNKDFEEGLNVAKKTIYEAHKSNMQNVSDLSYVYDKKADCEEALNLTDDLEVTLRGNVEIRENSLSPNDIMLAFSCSRLAFLLERKGNYEESVFYNEKASAIFKSLNEDKLYSGSVLSIARNYEKWSDSDDLEYSFKHRDLSGSSKSLLEFSIEYYLKALELEEDPHFNYSSIHHSIASSFEKLKDYKKAIFHYLLELKHDPEDSRNLKGITLDRISVLYSRLNDEKKSLEFARDALNYYKKKATSDKELSELHMNLANKILSFLSNPFEQSKLADQYFYHMELAHALDKSSTEVAFNLSHMYTKHDRVLESIKVLEETLIELDEESLNYAYFNLRLGRHYYEFGDKDLGKKKISKSYHRVKAMSNLTVKQKFEYYMLYATTQIYDRPRRALEVLLEFRNIITEANEHLNIETAEIEGYIGECLLILGDLENSKIHIKRQLEIYLNTDFYKDDELSKLSYEAVTQDVELRELMSKFISETDKNLRTSNSLSRLSQVLLALGEIEDANRAIERSFEIKQKFKSNTFEDIHKLDNRCLTKIFSNNRTQLDDLIKERSLLVRKILDQSLTIIAENKRLEILKGLNPFLFLGDSNDDRFISKSSLEFKGIVLDSIINQATQSNYGFTKEFTRDFKGITSEISKEIAIIDFIQLTRISPNYGIGVTLSFEKDECRVSGFSKNANGNIINKLKLGDRITAVGDEITTMKSVDGFSLSEIVDMISGPHNSSVNLQILRSGQKKIYAFKRSIILNKLSSFPYLGATVYTNSSESQTWIELPSLTSSLKPNNTNGPSNLLNSSPSKLREIYDLIVRPITSKLSTSIETLIICPDGELNFIPFHCLLDDNNSFLSEKYEVLQVSALRDLVVHNSNFEASKDFTIFASPDFDINSDPNESELAINSFDRNLMRNLSFSALPGALDEASLIQEIATEKGFSVDTKIGPFASEKYLNELKSPHILHLATHGFFISSVQNTLADKTFDFLNKDGASSQITNPMNRSGLLLAGAKNSQGLRFKGEIIDEKNDGILTANEASKLDLSKTWLTVLSACDTGSGVARAGEGVLGLRRAFAMAGTQNLLLTLWPVSDSFTKDFMVSFYEEALESGNAPKAMAKVQRDWLVKLREERSISQAVKLAGPFVLTFRGNPELN